MTLSCFVEPFATELPLENAVELNRLIQLQMEGSVGSPARTGGRGRQQARDWMVPALPDLQQQRIE